MDRDRVYVIDYGRRSIHSAECDNTVDAFCPEAPLF